MSQKCLAILFAIVWLAGTVGVTAFAPNMLIAGLPAVLIGWYICLFALGGILYLFMKSQGSED